MKKKLLGMMLSVVMAATLLIGCGGNGGQAGSGDGTFRVAYIARAQTDSFGAWLVNEMEAAAELYDDIALTVFDGQADDERMATLIESAITDGYDAIIVQPNNGEAQRPFVEQIVDAGIVAITTNARIEGIEGASSVDADPFEQAAVNARLAIEQVPENAQVVVLNGPSGNFHADARREAWQEVFFDARPDVTIVGEQIAHWNKDEAMSFMEDWVTSIGQIDAIISMNDNMAAGALEVVADDPNFANILSYGVDGTAEAVLLISEGTMTATAMQSAIDLAELVMSTVHQLLTGEADQIDVDIDAPLITIDNAEEFVEMFRERGQIR